MRHTHTVEQVRRAEADLMARLPAGTLMQRAATGVATAVADLLGTVYGARVLLLVGPGDNGGDALYAGARLARRGAQVEAAQVADRIHGPGLAALIAAGGRLVAEPRTPDVVVDGILGIGARPGLRGAAADLVKRYAGLPTVAVDVPSGVDVDTGRLAGPHVRADLTVTVGTLKIAHLVDPAAEACGVVHLVDLGLTLPPAEVEALQSDDVARLLPAPAAFDHKYTRGVVGVRAGSAQYPGAAVLCVGGAAAGLAGMVRYVGPAAEPVRARYPEVVVGEGRAQAWVVGSGGGDTAERALAEAHATGAPLVVDADAIEHVGRGGAALITPHAGELAQLLGVEREQVEADQLAHARRAAAELDLVVLLKGRHTLAATPDGRVRVTTTGVPWLATAGAGDVLAGLCGALLAAGLSPYDAGSVGSWVHGAAATLASGGGPITASRVAEAVPTVVAALLEQ